MDTTEAAQIIGTTPRTLRQFLRSPMSTFVAVGSGSRYDFDEKDITMLRKRFFDWQKEGKPKPAAPVKAKPSKPGKAEAKAKKDRDVWQEEGHVVIEDIRDPRVRARVRAAAQAAEDRLEMELMAAGLHISQGNIDSRTRRAS